MTGSMLGKLTGSQETEGVLHIIFNKLFFHMYALLPKMAG